MTPNDNDLLADKWKDLLFFIQKEDWKNAYAVMDSVGEQGFENDAVAMLKKINSAKEMTFEPFFPMDERDLADRSYPRE